MLRSMRTHPLGLAVGLVALGLTVGCSSSDPPKPAGDGGSTPTGWKAVIGEGAFFGQTFDDVSWHSKRLSPPSASLAPSLLTVTCFGNLEGWAAGENGVVAHTKDGGTSWVFQDAGLGTASLRAIRFIDATHGVVAGDGGAMATTADGGASWHKSPPLTTATLRGATGGYGAWILLVVGDNGTVLRSNDSGATFSLLASAGLEGKDLRSVAADPGAHVIYVVDTLGEILVSTDRGGSFQLDAKADGPLESVAVSRDGSTALAVGAHGVMMSRNPSGAWTKVAPATDVDLHAALLSDAHAYVAGDNGTLLTSTDRTTFTKVPLETTAKLYGLDDL